MQIDKPASHLVLASKEGESLLEDTAPVLGTGTFVKKTANLAKCASQRTREIMFFSPWQQRSKIRI